LNVKTRGALGKLALFGAAIIWGTSFFLVKGQVDVFAPVTLLAIRHTIATALLALIFHKKIRASTKSDVARSALLGVILAAAAIVQTTGITETTPGKNAFLTAVYCVIVPFLFWAVKKKRPEGKSFVAAFLCLLGIGLISLTDQLRIGYGDGLTLISGVLFAAHIVGIATVGRDVDPVRSIVFQFATCTVIFWAAHLLTAPQAGNVTPGDWAVVLYLAVFPTATGFLLQMIGQKYAPPTGASLILSLESVFGVLFSVLFYGEVVQARVFWGFAVVFAAIALSEVEFGPLKRTANARAYTNSETS
jgi:drug/metabolite transporter (DMT)-like permease